MTERSAIVVGRAPVLYRGLPFLLFILPFFPFGEAYAREGNFAHFFALSSEIFLQDNNLKFASIDRADVAPSGKIYAVHFAKENPHRVLKIFSRDGHLEREIQPPEDRLFKEYLRDVTVDRFGRFFLSATVQIRQYNSTGIFLRSYTTGSVMMRSMADTGKVWQANISRIDVDSRGWLVGAGRGNPRAFYLHVFDTTGRMVNEFFPFERKYMNMYVLNDPPGLDIDSLGDIWCTFPYFYKVFRYGMDGTPKGVIEGKSSAFKAPDRLEGPHLAEGMSRWIKSWTPVVNCAVTQSGYVILVMAAGEKGRTLVPNYNPKEATHAGGFFIDIYDRQGNMIAGGLHTPHSFLTVDKQDYFWFDLRPGTPENSAQNGPAVLGKFKLNLKPATAHKVNSKPAGRRK